LKRHPAVAKDVRRYEEYSGKPVSRPNKAKTLCCVPHFFYFATSILLYQSIKL
jgi:hypothetical protein